MNDRDDDNLSTIDEVSSSSEVTQIRPNKMKRQPSPPRSIISCSCKCHFEESKPKSESKESTKSVWAESYYSFVFRIQSALAVSNYQSADALNVLLNLTEGSSLGISFYGGDNGIYVGEIMDQGVAQQDGRISSGDLIVQVEFVDHSKWLWL